MSKQRNGWKTLARKQVYETKWFQVHEHDVLRPDGEPGKYSFMHVPPSVGVVAINDAEEVALVGQWRYAIGQYTWEIVRGGSDPGETDMLEVAKRELLEETGYEAEYWQPMDAAYTCTGLSTDQQYFFVATGLRFTGLQEDPAEPLDLRWVPLDQLLEAVTSGDIVDVCTIAAVLRYCFLRKRRA